MHINDCEIAPLTERVINAYEAQEEHLVFDAKVRKLVAKLVEKTLTYHNGAYNPLQRTVLHPELPFDIEITQPWAYYKFPFNGSYLEGFLRLKGTMDLLTEIELNTWELLDWKTGARLTDWASGKEKNYHSLQYDDQLLLYYYALRTIYPHVKNLIVTIFFIKHHPFTMCFTDKHYIRAENMLKKTFEEIKAIQSPRLNVSFRCRFCPLYAQHENTSKSICTHLRDEVSKHGVQKVTEKYATEESMSAYGSGGGRGHKNA